MCGICGVAYDARGGVEIGEDTLRAMVEAIVHRGPDEDGLHLADGVALGMRRLSIIDVAGGSQPIANEDGSVVTVFNGEIFNFAALRQFLLSRGHALRTSGDTETIVHLYEEFGLDFVRHLRGMFAIALWDATKRRLLLARDRLGVKPLYWYKRDGSVGFASEIKSLIAGGLIEPQLDEDAAALYLTLGYVPAPKTLFKDVYKLLPATTMEWRDGELMAPSTYWRPEDPPPVQPGTWEEDAENLLTLLRRAVHDRMVSEVPIGVLLSGGLDSSLIAALMAERSTQLQTFSVGFDVGTEANELSWARRVARRLDTNHHERVIEASSLWDRLDDALWHLEEPIADMSFLALLALSQVAREHVTVALCGQAADELLGGYPKHRIARVAELIRPLATTRAFPLPQASRKFRGSRGTAEKVVGALAAASDFDRLLALSAVIPPHEVPHLGPAFQDLDVRASVLTALRGVSSPALRPPLAGLLSLDVRLALPDLMFMYFDKMSMATSLEVRVPFADHDVVNFCMALVENRRIRGVGRGKELLRRASAGLVDEAVINRAKRAFFRAASGGWLDDQRGAISEVLLDQRTLERGLFDRTVIERLLAPAKGPRGAEPLLAAFMLEMWHRTFIDGRR
jgi:asparagine synthase (glutamine-hydrolysing)